MPEDWKSIERNQAWVTGVVVDHVISDWNATLRLSEYIIGTVALSVSLFPIVRSRDLMRVFLEHNDPATDGER